ncbi:papain fold toxin domain-containing protein [Tychonema sp. LEGE 07203]|uniref:papain fold toxin domain-containing protein n=1 Tax=Tychonema sp. LEGE 07203 TaxID=1828671 RepID=UPI0018818E40|nr:hypothetical protein [Tychonema sp. LEGE 07203]
MRLLLSKYCKLKLFRYENFKCVECASNIKDYLTSQGIHRKRIKLYTGEAIGWNGNIYDRSLPGEAISVNGCHEGIAIIINNIEIIFDNHLAYSPGNNSNRYRYKATGCPPAAK